MNFHYTFIVIKEYLDSVGYMDDFDVRSICKKNKCSYHKIYSILSIFCTRDYHTNTWIKNG